MSDNSSAVEFPSPDLSAQQQIDILNAMSRELSFKDTERAIHLAQLARQKSTEAPFANEPYLPGLAASLFNLARANNQMGRYTESLTCLLEARSYYEDLHDEEGLMWLYNEFGRVNHFLSDYPNALEYYLKALNLADKINHSNRQAGLRHNIAMVYSSTDEYQRAIEIATEGLRIAELSGDRWTQPYLLGGLAENHTRLKNYRQALEYGLRAVEMAHASGLHGLMHGTALAISWSYFELGEFEEANTILEEALQSALQTGDKRGYGEALRACGEQNLRLKKYSEALPILQQALNLAEELGEKAFIANCCLALSNVYAETGDFETALESHKRYHDADKAVFNETSDQRFKSLAILHQLENARKEAEIFQLRNVTLQKEIEERIHAQAALQHLANHDPLTGLWNRRVFFEKGEALMGQADLPAAVIMLDLDHFKTVNDRYGHQAGDAVLIAIAGIIQKRVRDMDLVCRYGGEEFSLLLPGLEETAAEQVAERLRQEISNHSLRINEFDIVVTVSAGVAGCGADHIGSFQDLIQAADQALYTAKTSGRNCVRCAGSE